MFVLWIHAHRHARRAAVYRSNVRGPLVTAGDSAPANVDWAALRQQNLPKPPRFSIGGLVVSGCSFLATLMMAINGAPLLAAITLWLGTAIAMLIWALGRPRRWWQGVATWFGGGFAGYTIGLLPLVQSSSAGLSFVAVFFLVGVGLLWLGFKRFKKQPATALDEAGMNPETQ